MTIPDEIVAALDGALAEHVARKYYNEIWRPGYQAAIDLIRSREWGEPKECKHVFVREIQRMGERVNVLNKFCPDCGASLKESE